MSAMDKDKLMRIVQDGDEWVRNMGIVTDAHKNILVHYISVLPRVMDHDIYLDTEQQRLTVILHIKSSILDLIRKKEPVAIEEAYNFLTAYLPTYQVTVKSIRYKEIKDEENTPISSIESDDSESDTSQ